MTVSGPPEGDKRPVPQVTDTGARTFSRDFSWFNVAVARGRGYHQGMRRLAIEILAVCALALCAFALPAAAAESTAESAAYPEAGREATIHLRDGGIVDCTVLRFVDGEFQIEQSGKKYTVPIGEVAKVAFGRAVGKSVRNPFAPPKPPPATAPATAAARPKHKPKRPVEDFIKSLSTRSLVLWLGRWTGRYQKPELFQRTEAGVKRMLAARPEKGQLDKNLRFLMVLLKIAEGETHPAKNILDELKRDYADDPEIQHVKVVGLSLAIERIKRPGRFPRRGPPRRPLLRGRERGRPRPDRGPPE